MEETTKHKKISLRLCLAGVCTVLLALLLAAWVWYDVGKKTNGQCVYQIVNDEYSQTVEIGEVGVTQTLTLPANQTVYGFRIDMCTYEYAFCGGTSDLTLYDAAGNEIGVSSLKCYGMRDNTFADYILNTPYTTGNTEETVRLFLRFTEGAYESIPDKTETYGDYRRLGVWASEETVDGMPMTQGSPDENGEDLNATMAIQLVTDYTANWGQKAALTLGGILIAAVAVAFVVLLVLQEKQWIAFVTIAVVLGGGFALLTPPLVAPDEYTHLAVSYLYSSELLGQPAYTEEYELLVRPADAPYFGTVTGDVGVLAYKQVLTHLGDTVDTSATTEVTEAYADTNRIPYLYIGQVLGITLARLLGRGFHAMLLLGRLGNLLCYVVLTAFAIVIAPKRIKTLFGCVALLPMPLQLAASLSADSVVLGLIFAFTALCFALREHPASRKELTLLLILGAVIAPAKAIYLPVVLLCLMIPREHLEFRKNPTSEKVKIFTEEFYAGNLVKLILLLAAAVFWLLVNIGALLYAARDTDSAGLIRVGIAGVVGVVVLTAAFLRLRRHPKGMLWLKRVLLGGVILMIPLAAYKLTHMWGGLAPDQLIAVKENGDAVYNYSIGYILRNIPATVRLLLRSVPAQGALWLQGILGTTLGEPIVYRIDVSWLLTIALLLVLLAAALPAVGEPPLLGRRSRLAAEGIVLCVVLLTIVAALTWTPINYETIFGVQGRYWLPVLPLALLPLRDNANFRRVKPAGDGSMFAVVCLTALTMLQGYSLYAAFQK